MTASGSVADPTMTTRFSEPLTPDFASAFDKYAPIFRIAWLAARGYELDPWQVDLLRRVLELKPDGTLRYRQVLISLPRQQGKSEIGAALGLWALLRKAGSLVIGIASSAEQARIIYDRASQIIRGNPALAKRFDALTDTRGLRARDGGRWEIKASKSAALQGLPIDLGLVDEVHLLKSSLWSDLVNGAGGRPNCLVVGTTTAGDDDSELLLHLYELIDNGKGGDAFGYFVWESPTDQVPDDDAELAELLRVSNPAIASGRLDALVVVSDVRGLPLPDLVRYRFNRFTKSENAFISASLWQQAARQPDDTLPAGRPVFTIDRTPDWGYASVSATVKDADGVVWTELVTSVVKPTLEQLVDICLRLYKHNPLTFAADGYGLGALLEELKRRGMPTFRATLGDVTAASAMFYGLLAKGRLRHADEPLLAHQIPRVVRKNVGDAFRISRKDSGTEIDAVMASVLGAYVCETMREPAIQVF